MSDRVSARSAAVAWLVHPATIVALALLLLNDHVLKAAYGTWWTGKLSDVAWLAVAPAVLALVAAHLVPPRAGAGPDPRTLALVAIGWVGVVFAVVKTAPAAAHLASSVLSALAGPSLVRADPTDLLALPALGVAWAAARAAIASRGRATRAARRERRPGLWLAVAPVALLALTATSAIPAQDGATRVLVVDGELVVAESQDYVGGPMTWYRSPDGSTWQAVDGASAEALSLPHATAAGVDPDTGRPACVPEAPLTCFRPAAQGGIGVERSDDGGTSWATEWSIPADDMAVLAERFSPPAAILATIDVAVLPSGSGGYRVYAADGSDGLAVRDESGAWHRLGPVYRPDPPPPVPLPGETLWLSYPVPQGVMVALLAALAMVPLLRWPPRPARTRTQLRPARVTWTVAAVAAVLGEVANLSDDVVRGQDSVGMLPTGLVVSLCVLLAAGFGLPAALAFRGRWPVVVILLAAAGVGALVEAIPYTTQAGYLAIAAVVVGLARLDRGAAPAGAAP